METMKMKCLKQMKTKRESTDIQMDTVKIKINKLMFFLFTNKMNSILTKSKCKQYKLNAKIQMKIAEIKF